MPFINLKILYNIVFQSPDT